MSRKIFPASNTDTLLAPNSPELKEIYSPIDCDFTDELEHVAVLKIIVEIQYWEAQGKLAETNGLITNIETVNKEEYLTVSSGTRIRLDRLHRLRIP